MLETLTIHTFAQHVGSKFTLDGGADGGADLELIEAASLGSPVPKVTVAREPFSLIFRGSNDFRGPQQVYRLTHDGLAAMDLFLVPVGPDAHGMRYQAIFT